METFGQAIPVSPVPLLTALLQRQQVYACFIDFQKAYDSVYGTMVCFISLVLKSVALYTSDSEHILEIAICSKNKQSLHEIFQLHKKDQGCACHPALTYAILM